MDYPRRQEGRVAIVTGAASGIGAAVARRLVAEGARVGALDRDHTQLKEAFADLTAVTPLEADVSDRAAVDAAFAEYVDARGQLDVLVHSAGVRGIHQPVVGYLDGEYHEMTDEEWQRVLSVNLYGTFHCVRAGLRHMVPRGSGSVVTLSSVAGLGGMPRTAQYSASKAGVRAFSQAVAQEAIEYGVRVNCVAPGPTLTPMLGLGPSNQMRQWNLPIKRAADPAEIAACICFLASDEASFHVGETMTPNGGMVIH
ncbi:MAG TPA: SDR family NAD(P)-dependent oxidoreductase [Pseudonocardia sp.]|jgi:3-oxoacyl-[acyl-carrier protein] reductase